MKFFQGVLPASLLAAVLFTGIFPARLAAEDKVHVVGRGETVFSISRLYRIGQEELMKHNNIADASKLQVGQRIRIPQAASQSGAPLPTATVSGNTATQLFTEYRVAKGDTLFSLARLRGTTVQALSELNSFPQNYVLKEGTLIKIPASGESKTVQVQPSPARPSQPAVTPRQTAPGSVDSSLRWPITAKGISYMTGKLQGVVVQGERLEPVKSLTQGTVISAGPYRGFGRVAIVQAHGDYLYVYGGCESLSVKEGDRIGPGTELGKLGIDAVSEKPQLFFMVYRSNAPIDPAKAPRA